MSEVLRFDKSQVITKVERTDEGYLRITAPIARSSVYNYRRKDGTMVREYIPSETLNNQDSIETLKLKPVTKQHPKKFVKSDSFKDLAIGTTGESISYENGTLYATFVISSQDGIDAVESGMNQLSPAYSCNVIEQSGITEDGEHYDAIQVNRRYNHLALVPKARGGDMLSFKIDCDEDYGFFINKGVSPMATIRVDGVDHAIENPAIVTHISALTVKAEKVDALESKIVEAEGATVALQAKLDAKDAEIQKLKADADDSVIQSRVDAKVALISVAESILGDELKADASDLDIMKQVILKDNPTFKYDGEHEEIYVKARFDSAVELHKDSKVALNRKSLRKDADETSKVDPRQARIDALESRYEGDK